MALQFQFASPPLPVLRLQHPTTLELSSQISALYPLAYRLGSMIRLSADHFLDAHHDEPTVSGWLFARYCDLGSIDRVLTLGGVLEAVPRPVGRPIYTTAASAADGEAQALSVDPHRAITTACALFWHIADRVAVISRVSTAAIILDAPGAPR